MFLPHLASRLIGTPLLLARAKLDVLLAVLGERVGAPQLSVAAFEPVIAPSVRTQSSIAMVPVFGTLVRRTNGLEAASGLTSYTELAARLQAASVDQAVRGILLEIDSPGGEAGGVFELAEHVRTLAQHKPVWAVAVDSALSAAYAIAAAANRVVVTRTAGVGSIGVIAMHIDQSTRDAQQGYRYTPVLAGAYKADLSPHAALAPEALTRLQREVDRLTAWQLAGTAAVTAAASTAAAWTTANLSLSAAVATAGLLKTSFAVLAAALIGWEIGTWLSEKFEIVRMAGIAMVQVLENGMETLKFSWERFAAIFTGDTIAAATQRHEERLRQMNAIFGEMYVDASEAGRAVQQAATTAAASAEEMARRLEAVRQGTQEAVGRGIEAIDATLNKLKSQITAIEQVVTAAQQGATQAISGITEAYQGLTGIVDATLQQQLASTQAHVAQKQVLLEQSNASEAKLIKETTQLVVDSVQQQSDLRAQALTDTLSLIEQEGQARRVAAQRQAETDEARRAATLRVDNEILAAKQQALAQAAADYVRHVDALNAEANRHLAEIRRIEDEKRALSQTTEDRIRELQRSTMGEYQAYQDKLTQVAELQRKARAAISEGEFEQAIQYAKQAQDLAAQTAKAVKDGDATVVTQKQAVKTAIDAMRESEQLAIQALEGEGRAHQKAASEATSARSQIEAALRGTQAQIEQIQAQLETGLKFAIDVDSSKLDAALRQLEEALREKAYLLRIDADLKAAHAQLRDLEAQLKDGKTLLVNADISRAKSALETLQTYADRTGQIDLKVATEKAQTSLRLVDSQIRALDQIRTESQHAISTNANQARSEIQSLNGMNTSSTHTIYVKRVEQNASGGLVGSGLAAPRGYAKGGSVLSFPRMKAGVVPGSGNGDTVPRALEAGAFVIRKAAVRKYGAATLRKLAGVARFATGGFVPGSAPLGWSASPGNTSAGSSSSPETPKPKPKPTPAIKVNRDVSEAIKLIELGLQGSRILKSHIDRSNHVIAIGGRLPTTDLIDIQAYEDRNYLQRLLRVRKLTSLESGSVDAIKGRWRTAMAGAQLAGVDLERQLIEYMDRETERQIYFARGGLAKSDTVPAMLTPGEYVVSRESVKRLGAGFFAAINAMKAPARDIATKVQGFARGGLVSPEASARLTRATVATLHAWAALPLTLDEGRFELRLGDGRIFEVAFRHADLCVEAEPVLGFPARSDTDRYRLTLRFLQL